MNEKWIKLHNKFLNWEWYKDTNTKIVFIHCLLKANWKAGKFEGYEIPRGSFVTSYKNLSEELSSKHSKVSIQSVRTALNHLVSTHELTIKTTNKFTIISINNYDLYQSINKQINTQLTNNQQTTNIQLTTIEEYKNNRIIDINNIYSYAEQSFGRSLSPVEIGKIQDWYEQVDDKRKIIYAINETVLNRVNNFKYPDAIIQNIKDKNYEELVKTKDDDEEVLDIPDYDWLNEED